jgi:hypothetical protein
MNANQKIVKDDIVNVIKLGVQASGYVDLSDYEIEQVLSSIYPKTKTNDRGQPIGDYPDNIPTQEEFDMFHTTPQGYGEESEWLLVSTKFSAEDALAKIQRLLKEEWGWSGGPDGEGYYPNSVDDLQKFDVGWGYDHDSYHYSEGGYWICSENNQVSKRWEAWGIATQ